MVKSLQELLPNYRVFIEKYGWSSYTLMSIEHLEPALRMLRDKGIRSMIDFGCGYGVLTCIIAEYLGIEEVWGIDIDDERIDAEKPCKITVVKHNLDKPLVIGRKFDLVTSFGVLEHIHDWNAFMGSILKLSKEGTWILISAPNLGSWINRLAIILGRQPRDLEIAAKLYHVLPPYRQHLPVGHIKMATLGAMEEFLKDFGFQVVKVFSLYSKHNAINIVDKLLKPFPSLARRYIILAYRV